MRQFKLLTVFLLLFGLTITYAGCSFFGTPQACLSNYLDFLDKNDYVAAYKLLSVKDKEARTLKSFSSTNSPGFSPGFNAVYKFLTKNTEYKIAEVKENKDKAVVKVTFTGPNSSAVWRALISETLRDKNEMDTYKALESEFKSKIPFESKSVSYNLVKEKDGWKVFLNFADTDKKAKEEKERKRQLFEIYKNKVKFTNIEVTHRSYDNTFSIKGYVQNVGDKPIYGLEIMIYGLDSNNKPIFEKRDNSIIFNTGDSEDILKPNYKKSFSIYFEENEVPIDWPKRYKFEITELELDRNR